MVTWNDQTHAYLLILIMRHVGKLPVEQIRQDWENDPNAPCETPTKVAIDLHTQKLKKRFAGGGTTTSATSTPKKTPTKRKGDADGAAPATPTKSAKKGPAKGTAKPRGKKNTPAPVEDEEESAEQEDAEEEPTDDDPTIV